MSDLNELVEKKIEENILIIDDQVANLRVLATMLKGKNYKVRKAIDGESAIKAVEIDPPDLILLDILMPELDGYEVCQRLKSDSKTKDIPIIFISALSEVLDKVKAFELGGIDYITKPFQEQEVLARINSQLTIKKQQKLLQKEHQLLKLKQQLLEQEQKKLKEEIRNRKHTEIVLSQSRALIASILTTSLDGISALEAVRNFHTGEIDDFRFLVINPILAKFFNQEPKQLIKRAVFKNLIQQVNAKLFNDCVQVVETGKPFKTDFSYQNKAKEKWYHFVAVKLADGFAITLRDITESKQLELQLNCLVKIDALTGINNRRTFDETLAKEWLRCQREKQTLSLILIDIDCFKNYNDYYGHQQGDNCLIRVAQAIARIPQRSSDLVARYGGEEFAVILPNTNIEGAFIIAESIRNEIALLGIPHVKCQTKNYVTLSLGVASLIPTPEISYDDLIAKADQALYTAKNKGRDRTICFESF